MRDITILFYTANLITEFFAKNIQEHLLQSSEGNIPIISISQKPLDFGTNICVGDIGLSVYNIYKQIFIGAKEAKTKYVACCEDDTLYTPEHFNYIPPDDTFCYNENNYMVNKDAGFFWHRGGNMSNCIALTALMVETLTLRFQKFPNFMPREQCKGFSEPGRHEVRFLGLPPVKMQLFRTEIPTITFNHRPSQGGVRKILPKHICIESLEPWGHGPTLWRKIHG